MTGDIDSWLPPAPGEDTLLASAPGSPTRAHPDEAGCWVDGARGRYTGVRMVEIAVARGMPLDDDDRELLERRAVVIRGGDDERWNDLLTDVEEWLNRNIAPEGHAFGWVEGDFLLLDEAGWCDLSDETCTCTSPHTPPVMVKVTDRAGWFETVTVPRGEVSAAIRDWYSADDHDIMLRLTELQAALNSGRPTITLETALDIGVSVVTVR
jgi:hypothetical protein